MKNGLYHIVITIVLVALTLPRSIAENTGLRRGRGHILAAVSSTTLEEQYDRGEGKEQEEMSERKLWWFHKEKWKLWYCSKWGHTHWGAKFCKPTCKESITVNTPVSSWNVGAGQTNDAFTLLEFEGVQVAIRAQQRFQTSIFPVPTEDADANGDIVGLYQVETGSSNPVGSSPGSWWNFDFHFDVSGATDPTKQTLDSYSSPPSSGLLLSVECIEGECGTFGVYEDLDLSLLGADLASSLFQGSQNPGFTFWPWGLGIPVVAPGDESYNQDAEATYKLCLTLGDFCPVCMYAKATAPAE